MRRGKQARGQLAALQRDIEKGLAKVKAALGRVDPHEDVVVKNLVETCEALESAQGRVEKMAQSARGLRGLMQRLDKPAIGALFTNIEANPPLKRSLQDLFLEVMNDSGVLTQFLGMLAGVLQQEGNEDLRDIWLRALGSDGLVAKGRAEVLSSP